VYALRKLDFISSLIRSNYLNVVKQIQWNEYFEPYVVVEKALAPKYWPEFVGRFFNKESQLAELFAMGCVFPRVLLTHLCDYTIY